MHQETKRISFPICAIHQCSSFILSAFPSVFSLVCPLIFRYMRGEKPEELVRSHSYPVSCTGLEIMQVGLKIFTLLH